MSLLWARETKIEVLIVYGPSVEACVSSVGREVNSVTVCLPLLSVTECVILSSHGG